jgi:hypothetical protein
MWQASEMSGRIACPECRSQDLLFNDRTDQHICKDCGHTFGAEEPFVPRRIFISYGHDEHAALAERMKADLEARGHEVWFDLDRLKPGGDWERYIKEGIEWLGAGEPAGVLAAGGAGRRQDRHRSMAVATATPRTVRMVHGS